MSSQLFGTLLCIGPTVRVWFGCIVGHTILWCYTHFTLRTEPNSDICIFLLDILTLLNNIISALSMVSSFSNARQKIGESNGIEI